MTRACKTEREGQKVRCTTEKKMCMMGGNCPLGETDEWRRMPPGETREWRRMLPGETRECGRMPTGEARERRRMPHGEVHDGGRRTRLSERHMPHVKEHVIGMHVHECKPTAERRIRKWHGHAHMAIRGLRMHACAT
eukprot:358519-Chlamydomonas_euryale.AAC.5